MRFGKRLQDAVAIDGLVKDGLWDVYKQIHMGVCAEMTAARFNISKQEQDEFSVNSYKRAIEALKSRYTQAEIAPFLLGGSKKGAVLASDEQLERFPDPSKLTALGAGIFKHKEYAPNNNSVTAGSSSSISDGGAALVLCTAEYAMKNKLHIEAIIKSYDDAEQKPEEFTIAPAAAMQKAITRAQLSVDEVDFFEINEAFAVVVLANMKLLKIDASKVNVFGGAIAMGHPIGCSGARVLCTLINVLKTKKGRYGCASLCNGGGGASAMVLENYTPDEYQYQIKSSL